MSDEISSFDVAIIGSGPAGLQAAIQAANAGKSTLLIEQEVSVGGACVHRGTIPSKTLRETALSLSSFLQRSGHVFQVRVSEELQVSSLMTRMEQVVKAHERYMANQLATASVTRWHGRAKFVDAITLDVQSVDRTVRRVRAKYICIASGSKPRTPSNVEIDHQNLLDSDSVLSMLYLPRTLTVLGGGVIATEYASIFAALGVKVTLIDSRNRPLGFLDKELTDRFLDSFVKAGGTFLGERKIERAYWDGLASCVVRLTSGEEIKSDKLLCCLGRVANIEELAIESAGIELDELGLIVVDEHLRTSQPNVYGIGDVIGPPSLASTSMEQGRRAIRHAFGLSEIEHSSMIPMGIYTIPEISSIGMSEQEAEKKFGGYVIGRARFDQVARGQIAAITDGLLKIVADPAGKRVLGVQIVGEGASDLVHVGQMAILGKLDVDVFVNTTFNFPTLAEAYRIAAADVIRQRDQKCSDPSSLPVGAGVGAGAPVST